MPAVLPGVGAAATRALLAKAGGNPRHLEQILLLAAASPELFEDGSPDCAFHADGLQRLLDKVPSYETAVRERFGKTPPPVRDTLAAASLQGNRFLAVLTVEVLTALRLNHDCQAAIRRAEDPYALVVRLTDEAAEFSETVYREVAEQGLADRGPDTVTAARAALHLAVMNRFSDDTAMAALPLDEQLTLFAVTAGLFEASQDPAERLLGFRALARAAGLARVYSDYPSLRGLVPRLEAAWGSAASELAILPFWELFEVQRTFDIFGRVQMARAAARALAERPVGSDEPSTRREHATGLTLSADQERIHGDNLRAADIHAEALVLFRALAAELGTPESRRDVSVSLNNVAGTKSVLGAPHEALPLYEASLALRRALAAEFGTPESRRDVAISYERLGDHARQALHDVAAAERYFGDALDMWRELDAALGIPDTKRGPAVMLMRLVELAEQRDDRATALRLAEEGQRLAQAYEGMVGDLPDARGISSRFREAMERLGGPTAG